MEISRRDGVQGTLIMETDFTDALNAIRGIVSGQPCGLHTILPRPLVGCNLSRSVHGSQLRALYSGRYCMVVSRSEPISGL